MKTKKKTKKRNPADTTMRNINALKKRVEKLEGAVDRLFRAQEIEALRQKLLEAKINKIKG